MATLTVKNKALTVSITQTGAVKRTQLKKRKHLRDIKNLCVTCYTESSDRVVQNPATSFTLIFPLPSFFHSFCHSLVLV